jgi:hypothetical protein
VRASGRCRGKLTLDTPTRALSSAGGGRAVVGRGSYAARAGATASVSVRLSAAAMRALLKAKRLRVLAVISVRDDVGTAPARRAAMTIVMPAKRRR